MMNNDFWSSDLGQLSGKAEDAFVKMFTQIPDDTFAPAQIEEFLLEEYMGYKSYKIHWKLIDGEFKGSKVFQRIKAFDEDPKKRHTALNMFKYLYELFGLSPKHSNVPQNQDLQCFEQKKAGLRIQLTKPNDDGKQYNYVSEVHPVTGFTMKSGVAVESAFSRHTQKKGPVPELDDEIPF